jgi:hypothetical protein
MKHHSPLLTCFTALVVASCARAPQQQALLPDTARPTAATPAPQTIAPTSLATDTLLPTVEPTDTPPATDTPTSAPTSTPTSAPVPTSTPTSAPTWTPTSTPTRRPTPTLTTVPTTTQTPPPDFTWQTDFEDGLAGFTGGLGDTSRQGQPGNTAQSYYEIVPDPTNSNHGHVYRAVVASFSTFENGTHRPYPDVYFPFKPGPFAIQLDVWVGQVAPTIRVDWSDKATFLNLISVKSTGDPDYCTLLMVNVEPRKAGNKVYYLMPVAYDYCQDTHEALPFEPRAPQFTFNEWHTIRVNVGQDGSVSLFQDRVLVSKGNLSSSAKKKLGLAGGHWGLYGNNIERATLLNDNIRLDVYPVKPP